MTTTLDLEAVLNEPLFTLEFGDLPGHPFRGNQYSDFDRPGHPFRGNQYGNDLVSRLIADSPEGTKALYAEDPQDAIATDLDLNNAPSDTEIQAAKEYVATKSQAALRKLGHTDVLTTYRGGGPRGDYTSVTLRKDTAKFFGGIRAKGQSTFDTYDVPMEKVLIYVPAFGGHYVDEQEIYVRTADLIRTSTTNFSTLRALEFGRTASGFIEFGDKEGHPFRGNQWGKSKGWVNPLASKSPVNASNTYRASRTRDPKTGEITYGTSPFATSHMLPPEPGKVEWNKVSYAKRMSKEDLALTTSIAGKLGEVSEGWFAPDDQDEFGIIDERGAQVAGPVVQGGNQRSGYCHWNSAEMFVSNPDRYQVESGYALVRKRSAPYPEGLDIPDDGWTDSGGIKPKYHKAAIAQMETESSWIAHSWVRDTSTGGIVETTGNEYATYFGAPLTPQETLKFIKTINPVKRVKVPKELRERFK